jgi:hypothetical protein
MLHPSVNAKENDWNVWVSLAKEYKKFWVEASERGDMPPAIFAERDGKVLCAVFAPQVDRDQALRAAAILRRALAIDSLTIILDAHIRTAKIEDKDEFLKKYKHGDMQKACDEEGACERGEISDCLICHRIGQDGKIQMATLTYSYHGKNGGVPFAWNNYGGEDADQLHLMDENKEGVKLEGNVPNALRQIIKIEPLTNVDYIQSVAAGFGMDREKQLYHCARAVYSVLTQSGYLVIDYLNHQVSYEEFKKQVIG